MASSPLTQTAPRSGQVDGPPPLPGSVQQVASPQGQQPGAPGAQAQAMIMQRAMLAMRVLDSLSPMMPGLGPVIDNVKGQLQQGIVQVFQAQQSGQGQGAAASSMPQTGGSPLGGGPMPPMGGM